MARARCRSQRRTGKDSCRCQRAEPQTAATALRRLIDRKDRVLSVLHPPNATCARIMEKAGCEVGFVGTGGVVGAYTGLADVGSFDHAGMRHRSPDGSRSPSDFPVIMDGDTGHGGIMAVRAWCANAYAPASRAFASTISQSKGSDERRAPA